MQLTMRDVTRIFNVPEKTVERWISQDSLPAAHVGGQYRFNRAELLEWANAHHVAVPAGLVAEPAGVAAAAPALTDALRAGGIFYGVAGTDKPSALRAVVDLMPLPPEMDRDLLLGVLLAREELASTGLGDGIAIPHVRNPIALHVARPLVSLCFLARPVEFGALDGKPVGTLFTLISPTVREHLHLLSRLSFAIRDVEFKACLLRQAPADEILRHTQRIETNLP
jgi:PTS system nitrogen regulatory IIA component